MFLDLGLGTLLKAGLHAWDGHFLNESDFSMKCSLKYRIGQMVMSIMEKPPMVFVLEQF